MKRPSFQWYPKDFLTDEKVEVMSLEEQGAYRRLMDSEWLHAGLPRDTKDLAKMCKVTHARFLKLWPPIERCFKVQRGGKRLVHPRLASERRKQDLHKAAKSKGGKAGAKARWGDSPEVAETLDDDSIAIDVPMAKNGSRALSSSSSVTAKEKPPYRGAKRKGPIPDGWEPNAAHAEIDEGRDLALEAARFRDHALSNGRVQIDWDAAFRNWLRSEYGRPAADGTAGGVRSPRLHMTAAEVKEWAGE